MKYIGNVWDKDALKNPETEYQNLLSLLRQKQGQKQGQKQDFGMMFVRCSPAEGTQIVKRTKVDIADQKIHVLSLDRPVADFYEMFVDRSELHDATVLFVTGIEEFLETKVKDVTDSKLGEKLEHFPRPLAHLSLLQSKLKERFAICFVFLLPLFALKFFIDSYPEFFEDSIEVFEFPTDMELLRQETFRWASGDRYKAYAEISEEERDHKYEDLQKLIAAQPLISMRISKS
jgi:superkiller protein 3